MVVELEQETVVHLLRQQELLVQAVVVEVVLQVQVVHINSVVAVDQV